MKNQQGLSLVELMISLTLGLVLTLGVVSLFATSQRSYRTLNELTIMQENAYFATHFIAEPLREAGFFQGCPLLNLQGDAPGFASFHRKPIEIATGREQLTIRALDITNARQVITAADDVATLNDSSDRYAKDVSVIMIANDCSVARLAVIKSDPGTGNKELTLTESALANATIYPLIKYEYKIADGQLMRGSSPLVTGVSKVEFRAINHDKQRDSGVLRAAQYSGAVSADTIGIEVTLTMVSGSNLNLGAPIKRTYVQTIAMRNRQVQ